MLVDSTCGGEGNSEVRKREKRGAGQTEIEDRRRKRERGEKDKR